MPARLPLLVQRGEVVVIHADPHAALNRERLPLQRAVNEDVAVAQLNLLSGQTDCPFHIRLLGVLGMSEDDDFPTPRLPELKEVLVDQQLVALVTRHEPHIDVAKPAVGTNRRLLGDVTQIGSVARSLGEDGIVDVVSRAAREGVSTVRANDLTVISQQTGGHRAGRDHVAFRDESAKEDDRQSQQQRSLNKLPNHPRLSRQVAREEIGVRISTRKASGHKRQAEESDGVNPPDYTGQGGAGGTPPCEEPPQASGGC